MKISNSSLEALRRSPQPNRGRLPAGLCHRALHRPKRRPRWQRLLRCDCQQSEKCEAAKDWGTRCCANQRRKKGVSMPPIQQRVEGSSLREGAEYPGIPRRPASCRGRQQQ